jgi:catechol 2,3-dioxygenase-like lactoylglutathione lyase family enzyme
MKIGHIELFVVEPLASKEFFEKVLGFELVVQQSENLIWLKCGDVEILLRPAKASHHANSYAEASSAIVLYTEDVQKTAATLRERGLVFKGTDGQPDCLTFTDPDGHWFQLVNPEHP